MREKHAADIWVLVGAIRNHQPIPRVLLRNGKRARAALLQSQDRVKSTSVAPAPVEAQSQSISESLCVNRTQSQSMSESLCVNHEDYMRPSSVVSLEDVTDKSFKSQVLSDINALKNSISDIKHSLRTFETRAVPTPQPRACLLYVRLCKPYSTTVSQSLLETLLSCSVLHFCCVRVTPNPAYKVKILVNDLHEALKSGHKHNCFVTLWREPSHLNNTPPSASSHVPAVEVNSQPKSGFFVGCWNCRGLANSVPYILELVNEKPGVLVLAEHWL